MQIGYLCSLSAPRWDIAMILCMYVRTGLKNLRFDSQIHYPYPRFDLYLCSFHILTFTTNID